jgi:hypothetical protein
MVISKHEASLILDAIEAELDTLEYGKRSEDDDERLEAEALAEEYAALRDKLTPYASTP